MGVVIPELRLVQRPIGDSNLALSVVASEYESLGYLLAMPTMGGSETYRDDRENEPKRRHSQRNVKRAGILRGERAQEYRADTERRSASGVDADVRRTYAAPAELPII